MTFITSLFPNSAYNKSFLVDAYSFLLQQYFNEKIYDVRTGALYKISISSKKYYLKIYRYPRFLDVWKIFFRGGLIGRSRAKVEYDNLHYLHNKNLSPAPVFFFEKKSWFLLQYSFLVMEEVIGASSLDLFIFNKVSLLSCCRRQKFIKSLALATKKMNEYGFVNGEYHWRNILVTEKNDEYEFQVIDCCKSRKYYKYFFKYYDIASLNVYAEKFFSQEERLLFFKTYFGIEGELSRKHLNLIHKIKKLTQKISHKELKRYESVYRIWQKKIIG